MTELVQNTSENKVGGVNVCLSQHVRKFNQSACKNISEKISSKWLVQMKEKHKQPSLIPFRLLSTKKVQKVLYKTCWAGLTHPKTNAMGGLSITHIRAHYSFHIRYRI